MSSSSSHEGYRARAALERPARIGRLAAPLTQGVPGRFNRRGAIEIDLFFGGLSAAEEQAVLNGENRLAVKAANGAWEVIGFGGAEEIAPNHWCLTDLLRGLAGTEDAMDAGAATGAAAVVLDDAVVPLGISGEERGLSLNWLVESSARAGGRAGPFPFSGGMRAETPLAPVHVRGTRLGNGNVHLTWTRRGRLQADDWDAADIPLDEPDERYRIELLDGEDVRRQMEVAGTAFTYAATDEIADFGGQRAQIRLRIRQMGRAVPLGIAANATINL